MTPVQSLRIIWRLTVIDFTMALIYRIEFLLFMVSTVIGPLISLLIWRAAIDSGANLPVDGDYLTTYFVLLGVVSMLTSSWASGFLADSIRLGGLAIWVARPGSTLYNLIANNLSEKAVKLFSLSPLIAAIWWPYRDAVALPTDGWRWALFAVAVVASAVMMVALDILVGSLAFWIDDITGIDQARGLLSVIFRGQLVPLALMPGWAQGFVDVQPFRFTLSFPLEILLETLEPRALATGMVLQLLWPIAAVIAARVVWRRGLRSWTAAGV